LNLLKEAARSIVTRSACLKEGSAVLIICGRHNAAFAEDLQEKCCCEGANPHLWMFNENLLKRVGAVSQEATGQLPKHTRSLLKSSDLIIWLTQFENPKTARDDLGAAVCSYWGKVDETVKGKPVLWVSLLSARSLETMGIDYEGTLAAFARAANVDYDMVRRAGLTLAASLDRANLIQITDPNGTDLTFSIENRKVGIEVGTLKTASQPVENVKSRFLGEKCT
jgi:leucyl aminopeptidase (aminopeptidase T)